MKTLSEIQKALIQFKPLIQEQYHIKTLGVFGSYIRGEQREESDIDILVEFQPEFPLGLLTFCQLEEELSQRLGLKVDLVMKTGLKRRIGEQILQEVIYL